MPPKAKAKAKGRSLPRSTGSVVPTCGLADKGKVFKPYDIDLKITDEAKNMDKFYRMQVVESTDKSKYWFVQHWGRSGTAGQMQVKGPTTSDAAVKMIEAKFKSKTGKAWADRGAAGSGSADSSARSGKGHYELTARLKGAGAKFAKIKGAIAISLMWNHSSKTIRNDLDLWVTAPSGEKIGYKSKRSKCGGILDVDMQRNAPKPVENIVWTTKAPKGNYTVKVQNFSATHQGPMEFTVGIVRDGGKMEVINKRVSGKAKEYVLVKKFKYG